MLFGPQAHIQEGPAQTPTSKTSINGQHALQSKAQNGAEEHPNQVSIMVHLLVCYNDILRVAYFWYLKKYWNIVPDSNGGFSSLKPANPGL
jgi:hypothetical protein